jgi:membrane-associated PAP2 superfamily phosphatase
VNRDWRFDLVIGIAILALITIVFAATDLDIAAARIFYRAESQEHWPLGGERPWSLLYAMAPWITASLVVAGFAAMGAGLVRGREDWRRDATLVLLAVVLGPGLLVNLVFKDHWHRPRPRDVAQFGGQLHYTPPPLRGEGGKSFPCGHCSVGFLYGVGWWLWRRRSPYLAAASLAIGLLAGTALGVGRMAAGGHFLSDIVWSALLAFGVTHALYHYVLRTGRLLPIFATLGGAGVLVALFATPHGTQIATEIPLASLAPAPKVFEFTARTANVEIIVVDSPRTQISVAGELHGFGLPTSRLVARSVFEREPIPKLRYVIEQHGWITDLDASLSIRLPVAQFERIVVRLERGNVKVIDASTAQAVKSGRLLLDLGLSVASPSP